MKENEDYKEITYYDNDGKKKTERVKKKDLQIGKPGMLYDEEGNEYTLQEWRERQRLIEFRKELEIIKIDGRSNKEKIRDYIIEKIYASRKELMSYFVKNDVNYPIMSEKTLDNNLKRLREEKTIILQNPENLIYVYNMGKPLIKTEYTRESTIRAYHIHTRTNSELFERSKHDELKDQIMHNIGYIIYHRGEEDKDFFFSNTNMDYFSVRMNDLVYKCFLGNPDMFYRFRKKDDFYFSLLITVDFTKDPNFEEFYEKYYKMKERMFKKGFPTLAGKIETKKDIDNFIRACEERQKAAAKLQHEERDKGIKEILASSTFTEAEKSYKIQELLDKLELDVYKKFSPFNILDDFDNSEN